MLLFKLLYNDYQQIPSIYTEYDTNKPSRNLITAMYLNGYELTFVPT